MRTYYAYESPEEKKIPQGSMTAGLKLGLVVLALVIVLSLFYTQKANSLSHQIQNTVTHVLEGGR